MFVGLLAVFGVFFFCPFFTKTDTGNDQQTNKPTLGQNSLKSFALERI